MRISDERLFGRVILIRNAADERDGQPLPSVGVQQNVVYKSSLQCSPDLKNAQRQQKILYTVYSLKLQYVAKSA